MAVFRLQVFYQGPNNQKWSNVYHVDSPSLADAASAFTDNMQPSLLVLLTTACLITKALFSSLTDDTFLELPINEPGESGDTTVMLPLFNSIKVLFSTGGLGRPDYKFLKGIMTEGANEGGFVASSVKSAVTTAYGVIISEMSINSAPLVSEDGEEWSAISVQDAVQMRQMHRRRRRTTPTP
jgi:hypothetical protein